jgi:hypothetical protein
MNLTSEVPSPSEVYSGPSKDHFLNGECVGHRRRSGGGGRVHEFHETIDTRGCG